MKKNLLFVVAALFGTTLFLASCSKNDTAEIIPVEQDNFLKFEKFADFHQAISSKNLEQVVFVPENFTSMIDALYKVIDAKTEDEFNNLKTKYASILILENGIPTDIIVEDNGLARLLNEDGVVQIGNEYWKFERDFVKIIKDGDKTKLDLLDRVWDSNNVWNIEVLPITRRLLKDRWTTDVVRSDGKYKLNIDKYATTYSTFSIVGGELNHYEWRKPWWGGSAAWYMTSTTMSIWVSWDGLSYILGKVGDDEMIYEGPKAIQNTNETQKDIQSSYSPCWGQNPLNLTWCGELTVYNFRIQYWTKTGFSGYF